jgi:agmatine deiminase
MRRRGFIMAGAAVGVAMTGAIARSAGTARFHVPAEEAPQEMAIMQWPVNRTVYDDAGFLRHVQATIADIANAISAFQPVIMLADKSYHPAARKRLSAAVTLWDVPTDDLWARDSGPIVAVDGLGNRNVRHIRFNGWGGRQEHTNDGLIAQRVAERLGLPLVASTLLGEAGGVEQDGHGLLIAHESSWVHDNRNPGMSRDAIGAALLADYGADRIIWSPGLKDEDITDYHIDSLLRLTGPGRALVNMPQTPDAEDPFHNAAAQTLALVQAAGLQVDIIAEPEKRRVKSIDFVASYANYFVCNGAVIAAQFGDADTDAAAVSALQRHYPGREIITLNVDALGEIGGGIHCATHEVPAA